MTTYFLPISLICYGIVALFLVFFGLIYLTRNTFMPYHSDALQASWTELDEKLQTLILALMRVVGGGLLTTGILIVVLLAIPYRAGETWAAYTIPALALITCLSSLYATSSVKIKTSASPPVELSLAAVVLISLGFFFSRL